MLLIGLRSTSPHFVKSGSGRRGRGRGAALPPPASAPSTNACTSSTLMRPPGPVPLHLRGCRRRARARGGAPTGAAGGAGPCGRRRRRLRLRPRRAADVDDLAALLARRLVGSPRAAAPAARSGASASAWPRSAAPAPPRPRRLLDCGSSSCWRAACLAASAASAAAAASRRVRPSRRLPSAASLPAPAPSSTVRTTWPTLTFSPCLTRTSLTVPATLGRHFDRGLVGLELEDRLVLRDRVARLDQHADDVAGGDVLAQFGKLEFCRHAVS